MEPVSGARTAVVCEARRILRGLAGVEPGEGDVLLFGTESPVASPFFLKNGVDYLNQVVYNSSKHSDIEDSELFRGFKVCGGFVEFELAEGALERLFLVFESELEGGGEIAERFTWGRGAECIHARLLHAAQTASPGFFMPGTPLSQRALWLTMMAGSPAQRNLALEAADIALNEHRSKKTLCARVAEAMARAVLDRF